MKEFSGKMHERWMAEFQKHLPMDKPLRILDLGTGTGFFCFLLGAEGHQVTGIDLPKDMILHARQSADVLKIPVDFCVMDAEKPDFAPGSFDALVTRNLTWGLPHLPEAYRNWFDLLKPGGVLINFDADYCREKKAEALPENHAHKGIAPELSQEYENFKNALRPVQQPRPQWDVQLLLEAGFQTVTVDTGVWKRIYQDFDEFYNPTPIFTIVAHK
jgi:SAM-dependent methyltransferase